MKCDVDMFSWNHTFNTLKMVFNQFTCFWASVSQQICCNLPVYCWKGTPPEERWFLERASRTEYTDCVQRVDWRWSWARGTAQCSGTGSGSAQCNSGSGLDTAALQGYCTHTADGRDGHRTGDKTQAVVHTDMEGGRPMHEKERQKCLTCFVLLFKSSFMKYLAFIFKYSLHFSTKFKS